MTFYICLGSWGLVYVGQTVWSHFMLFLCACFFESFFSGLGEFFNALKLQKCFETPPEFPSAWGWTVPLNGKNKFSFSFCMSFYIWMWLNQKAGLVTFSHKQTNCRCNWTHLRVKLSYTFLSLFQAADDLKAAEYVSPCGSACFTEPKENKVRPDTTIQGRILMELTVETICSVSWWIGPQLICMYDQSLWGHIVITQTVLSDPGLLSWVEREGWLPLRSN